MRHIPPLLALGLATVWSSPLPLRVGSGPTYHSGQIDTNEVWLASGNPHILDSDVWTGDSVTLAVMPGCTLQFAADVELYTGYASPGSIIAVGTADSTITFTSLSDTVPGFWDCICFYGNTMPTARMSYCDVEFGGKTSDNLGAVRVEYDGLKFDHNLVRKSGSNGVWLSSGGSFGDFTNNTVTGCARYAVHITAEGIPTLGAGNTLTGNTKKGIEVHSIQVRTSGTWLNHGVPYVLTDDVAIDNNATVTIEAGCTIALDPDVEFYCGYASPGSLVAVGSATEPITFTASTDTVAGIWSALSFYPGTISTTRLSYVTVEGAGSGFRDGAVYVEDCAIKMDHCILRKNAKCGVYCTARGYFADFSNNAITGSGEYPIRIGADEVRTLGVGNALTGNTKDGILVHGMNVKTSGTWLNHGVPYVIDDDVSVEDANNSPVLTIAPGSTVKLQPDVEFYVGYSAPGGLIADGTSDSITFTSSLTPPSAGDWQSLSFFRNSIDSQCRLINCKVQYAGSHDGNVRIENCTPAVTGCDIGYSAHWGIYLNGSEYPNPDQLRADNFIHDCVDGDIRDPGAGVEEKPLGPVCATEPASVVRNVLLLPEATSLRPQAASLLDISGRRVLDLKAGPNDVSRLAPGVYFVVTPHPNPLPQGERERGAVAVRKVVLTE
jgi:hypothetical protein